MTPREHGIVAFGQDTTPIQGRCVWDVLDKAGVSTGVFGSLLSFPPRNAGAARYYVPESLADDPDCFPAEARPVQEFSVFTSRNYSESFARQYVEATRLLLGSMRSGVRPGTVLRTLLQIPRELLQGDAQVPERAMIQSYILTDAFKRLYADHKPRFATLHLNNVAYMQHRYWRAAEPDRFRDELSLTDHRFFGTVAERKAYEQRFASWIERSLIWTDRLLDELLAARAATTRSSWSAPRSARSRTIRCTRSTTRSCASCTRDELFAALGFPRRQGADADESGRVAHPAPTRPRPSAPPTCCAACTCIPASPCSRWIGAGRRCFWSCSCRGGSTARRCRRSATPR